MSRMESKLMPRSWMLPDESMTKAKSMGLSRQSVDRGGGLSYSLIRIQIK